MSVNRHVVDQDDVGLGGQRFVDFLERLRFDLDRQAGTARADRADGARDAARQADVIVLDEDRVEQARAVIGRAAGARRRTSPARAASASSFSCRGS